MCIFSSTAPPSAVLKLQRWLSSLICSHLRQMSCKTLYVWTCFARLLLIQTHHKTASSLGIKWRINLILGAWPEMSVLCMIIFSPFAWAVMLGYYAQWRVPSWHQLTSAAVTWPLLGLTNPDYVLSFNIWSEELILDEEAAWMVPCRWVHSAYIL